MRMQPNKTKHNTNKNEKEELKEYNYVHAMKAKAHNTGLTQPTISTNTQNRNKKYIMITNMTTTKYRYM